MTEDESDATKILESAQRLQSWGMTAQAEKEFIRAAQLFEHEGREIMADYARQGAEYCGELREL